MSLREIAAGPATDPADSHDYEAIAQAADTEIAAEQWTKLIAFDAADTTLPSLDAEWLPSWAGRYAQAISNELETPPELAIAMVLGACATAVARCMRVQVTDTHKEVACLWLAVALPPGNAKSAVESRCAGPLRDYEVERSEAMKHEIIERQSDIATQEQRVKALRAKAAKAKVNELDRLRRDVAEAEKEIPEPIREPRLWTSDITPERLAPVLADNHECMAWLSAEAGLFDLLQGRYSGGVLNLDLFLKAYSGDPERVDRGSRPSVTLRNPRLTMCLTPQPDVLRGLSSVPGFRGRGLLGRFWFFVPRSNVGYRHLKGPPASSDIAAAYNRYLRAMLEWHRHDDTELHDVPLSPAAHSLWQQYRVDLEPRLRPDGQYEAITDWAAKSAGTAARVAVVLHAMDCCATDRVPWDSKISAQCMAAALMIAETAKAHALHAFRIMGGDEKSAKSQKAWDWIARKNNRQPFSARDLFNALQRTYGDMRSCNEALDDLCERGYIRPLIKSGKRTSGRNPSPQYEVRPDA